jgi:hypothetical protein
MNESEGSRSTEPSQWVCRSIFFIPWKRIESFPLNLISTLGSLHLDAEENPLSKVVSKLSELAHSL